jgi:hypothetical protein
MYDTNCLPDNILLSAETVQSSLITFISLTVGMVESWLWGLGNLSTINVLCVVYLEFNLVP